MEKSLVEMTVEAMNGSDTSPKKPLVESVDPAPPTEEKSLEETIADTIKK
jgi:hypothetical protein